MLLEIKGLTRAEELAFLLKLPWTFTSLRTTDAPDEYEVHVEEMRDAMSVGDQKFVGRDIFEALESSIECRLDHDDPIPLPRAFIVPPQPIVISVGTETRP